MTFRALLDWLIEGTQASVLEPSWLANKERLALYEAYTARQLHSSVVFDTAATARQRFWMRHCEQRYQSVSARPSKVKHGQFGAKVRKPA